MMHRLSLPIAQSAPGPQRYVPPFQPLRFVSACNRTANQVTLVGSGSYQTTMTQRYTHIIGSGDVSEIRPFVTNFTVGNSGVVNPGNTITIDDMFVEHPGLGITVRVTFGGQNSITLANGEIGVEADPIYPSVFGLSSFARGLKLFERRTAHVPLSGVIGQMTRADSSTTLAYYYNPGATACTNLSGTGALTFSGTSPTVAYAMPSIWVGRFVSGDPYVWLGNGDSILEGAGDTATGDSGGGYFSRALMGTVPGLELAGLNMGKPSGGASAWSGSGYTYTWAFYNLMKYASGAVCEYGTNNFDATANGNASNRLAGWVTEWGNMNFMRTFALNHPWLSPFKIVRCLLMPRCASAGFSDASVATQTLLGPKWDAGGDAELYNTQMAADVGVFRRSDLLFDPSPHVRASQSGKGTPGSDWYFWAPNTCGDGTHPINNGHALCGGGLRTVLLSA